VTGGEWLDCLAPVLAPAPVAHHWRQHDSRNSTKKNDAVSFLSGSSTNIKRSYCGLVGVGGGAGV
jgi:hypothetical protein